MDNNELNRIALQTAKSIVKTDEEERFSFHLKGAVKEWDESANKTVFDIVYNVFKRTLIIELEMNPETGEVLVFKEIKVKESNNYGGTLRQY